MKEIWVPVKGYEGLYEVSNLGNVRSLGNGNSYNSKYSKTRILKQSETNGYLHVTLSKNGKKENVRTHRLVAQSFIPNWFEENEVNHIDENTKNNNVDNLEWCDRIYNNNYGTRNDRVSKSLSKPVLQFTKTGDFVREWSSTQEVGKNGFCQTHVCDCCNGKLKSHKGFIWKYKNSEKQSA